MKIHDPWLRPPIASASPSERGPGLLPPGLVSLDLAGDALHGDRSSEEARDVGVRLKLVQRLPHGLLPVRLAVPEVSERTRVAELNLCEVVERPRREFTLYSSVIRVLQWTTGMAFVGGFAYAMWVAILAAGPVSAVDELLLLVTYRIVLVMAAVIALYWCQSAAARDRAALNWFHYVAALALLGAGTLVLVLSVTLPLR